MGYYDENGFDIFGYDIILVLLTDFIYESLKITESELMEF